jgi:hypothetical protein
MATAQVNSSLTSILLQTVVYLGGQERPVGDPGDLSSN